MVEFDNIHRLKFETWQKHLDCWKLHCSNQQQIIPLVGKHFRSFYFFSVLFLFQVSSWFFWDVNLWHWLLAKGTIDMDLIMTGISASERTRRENLVAATRNLVMEKLQLGGPSTRLTEVYKLILLVGIITVFCSLSWKCQICSCWKSSGSKVLLKFTSMM